MDKNIDFNHVADIYDYYVNVDFDVPFYIDFCKGYNSILELMCGTGRVSIPLINEGYSLTCVDYSEDMLEVFKRKINNKDSVDIVCQDVCNLKLEKSYDLAIIPFNSIAEITDYKKRKQAIQGVYNHLEQNGTFLCTLYNPSYRVKSADGNTKPLGEYNIDDDKKLIVTYFNTFSEKEKLISGVQFYEIYDSRNHLIEKRYLDINFSVIDKEEIVDVATSVGFSLKEIYGDYQKSLFTKDSPFMNFIFQK